MRGNMRITVARRAQMLSMMKLTNLPFLYENPKISTGFSNRHVFIASQLSTSMEFIVSCALFFSFFFFLLIIQKSVEHLVPSDTTRYEIDFYNAIRDEKKPSFVYGNPFESRTKNFVTSLDVSLTFVNLIRYVYIYIYIYISVVVSIVLRFKK